MKLPFVTRSHHEEVVAELKRQLSELDTERKRIWDAYCASLGIPAMFSPSPQILKPTQPDEDDESAESDVAPVARRPSQIMAAESARKQKEFVQRYNPSSAAAAEIDAAKARGVAAAKTQ